MTVWNPQVAFSQEELHWYKERPYPISTDSGPAYPLLPLPTYFLVEPLAMVPLGRCMRD